VIRDSTRFQIDMKLVLLVASNPTREKDLALVQQSGKFFALDLGQVQLLSGDLIGVMHIVNGVLDERICAGEYDSAILEQTDSCSRI
jgi:hypothetical protein